MLTERSQNEHAVLVGETFLPVWQLTDHNSGRTDTNGYIQYTYRMPNA